jgi:nudix-type nucleoside diphosphatase (YffH/AdpP family)
MSDLAQRVRVESVQVLSDDWYTLKKTIFDFRRSDGLWQRQSRETYDRGNGATILLYNRKRRTVVLTRQFRYPAFVNGYSNLLIEAPAGLLDEHSAEESIRKETAEETGYVIHDVHKIFEAFMSPGSVTEKLYFFVAEYDPTAKRSEGGDVAMEGEDIEVFELTLEDALARVASGEICDGKTIMLLQYARLNLLS